MLLTGPTAALQSVHSRRSRPSVISTARPLSVSESCLVSVELATKKPRLSAQIAFTLGLVCEAIKLRSSSTTSCLVCVSVGCRCAAAGPTAKVHALAVPADLQKPEDHPKAGAAWTLACSLLGTLTLVTDRGQDNAAVNLCYCFIRSKLLVLVTGGTELTSTMIANA